MKDILMSDRDFSCLHVTLIATDVRQFNAYSPDSGYVCVCVCECDDFMLKEKDRDYF